MRSKKLLIFILGLLVNLSCFAADPEPMVLMKQITNQMLHELDKHIGHLKNNYPLVNSLVKKVVVPHFDLAHMSKAVVGREYWQKASPATQQQFINEFTSYVIRTYSSALQSYDGEIVKFSPMREVVGDQARISSDLMLKNGPPIQLQYGLIKRGAQWFIYDFSVDGVSIIKNYNAQFASLVRQNGLDGLVRELQKRNGNYK